jgi:S-adenosylmethionine hydrolase
VKSSGIITLTTDFGLEDPYAAVMKGVVLSINPAARIIDISHSVKAGSVMQAAMLIKEAYPFFPKGTVHVAVIDPGVGGKRRPILVKTEDHFFIGPDNGVFWPIIKGHEQTSIIHITESRYFLPDISRTFHGRDIFAPVAAHISIGMDPLEMGQAISDPVTLEFPVPEQRGETLYGRIMRIDHFGNLITNIKKRDLEKFLGPEKSAITLGKLVIEGLSNTYSEVGAGETLALIGSTGCLEISVNKGRASDFAGTDPDAVIDMEIEVRRI